MKRTQWIAVLAGLAVTLAISSSAHAMYMMMHGANVYPGVNTPVPPPPMAGGYAGQRVGMNVYPSVPIPMAHPDGQNLYQYVRSNPVNLLDPEGLAAIVPGAKEPPWGQENAWKILDSLHNSMPYASLSTREKLSIDYVYSICSGAEFYARGQMEHSRKAMKHYLGNTGTTMDVSGDMRQILNDGWLPQQAYPQTKAEVENAARTIEQYLKKKERMPEKFVSDKEVTVGSAANADLKGLTNAFTFWMSIDQIETGRYLNSMRVTFHLRDVYDWDINDKGRVLKVITNAEVGLLHFVGSARAYKVIGTSSRTYYWECGKTPYARISEGG